MCELLQSAQKQKSDAWLTLAQDIANMSEDKILFLSFLTVLTELSVNSIERDYDKLLKQINPLYSDKAFNIYRPVNSLIDSSIIITYLGNTGREDASPTLKFFYQSYSKSLLYTIKEVGSRETQEIFTKVLTSLAYRSAFRERAIRFIFNNLRWSRELMKVLYSLADNEETADSVAHVLTQQSR